MGIPILRENCVLLRFGNGYRRLRVQVYCWHSLPKTRDYGYQLHPVKILTKYRLFVKATTEYCVHPKSFENARW